MCQVYISIIILHFRSQKVQCVHALEPKTTKPFFPEVP